MCFSWLLTMEFVVFVLKKIYHLSPFQQVLFRKRYVFLNKLKLGAGLVIFKEGKPRYCRRHGGSHVYPVLSFRKPIGTYQTVLSPFSRCSPCGLTGASSAASSTPSSTDFSGRMLLRSTARTKPCTTVLLGGVSSDFLTNFQ